MPHKENDESTKISTNLPVKEPVNRPLIDETVTAHLLQIFGNQNQQYAPTQAQVDKILSLQEKGMDYTHKERTTISPKQKITIAGLVVAGIVFLALFFSCLFYAKEYLGEVITGVIGFFAGGASGYGIGKIKHKNDEE